LYSKWAPFPLSASTGIGQPIEDSQPRHSADRASAASCSASLDGTPAGRTGSKSNGSQVRRMTSASPVVCRAYCSSRLQTRASKSGLMRFNVQ
jgi:hypothetical protein